MTKLGYDLDALRVAFPCWSFFRSDSGALYATRSGVRLGKAELDAGLQQTVSADELGAFVEALDEQNGLG